TQGRRNARCARRTCEDLLRIPQLRILVAAAKACAKGFDRTNNSQKPPSLENGAQQRPCGKPSMRFCEHCDRNLCGLHYSDDRLLFQAGVRVADGSRKQGGSVTTKTKAKLLSDWKDFYGKQAGSIRLSSLKRIGSNRPVETALDFDISRLLCSGLQRSWGGRPADSANMRAASGGRRLCQQLMKRHGCNPSVASVTDEMMQLYIRAARTKTLQSEYRVSVKFQKRNFSSSDQRTVPSEFKMNSDCELETTQSKSRDCRILTSASAVAMNVRNQFNYMATFNYSFQKLPDKELHCGGRMYQQTFGSIKLSAPIS
uniref:ANF_receptor domain-containing protein n=1 Tax=Macrostomum lignano TaxID=282301 RepID=A0A1I8F6N7_9PLAT